MDHPVPVYMFRNSIRTDETVVNVAPLEAVATVFGRGGTKDTDGLLATFGGAAVFSDDSTGAYFLGVWGARKASRFRRLLREAGLRIEVIEAAPPARLAWYSVRERQRH